VKEEDDEEVTLAVSPDVEKFKSLGITFSVP
jgi:hypothetical protein